MIPFLHLGPITIPTFGLMVAIGLLVAAYILQADFNRRRQYLDAFRPKESGGEGFLRRFVRQSHNDEGFLIIGIAGIAGLLGAKMYHALQDPQTWRTELISRFGFAWFGGLIGGFLALVYLARLFGIPMLEFMDMCSPAAAVGYAIGRIGCLLSGDGDYGVPTNLPWGMSFPNGVVPTTERVHPTPLYEFLAWMLIAYMLWRMGARLLRDGKPAGLVFGEYLVMTGIARFLVEIIRLNPRSFLGMSNAQTASVASLLLGVFLLIPLHRASSVERETS